MIESGLYEEVTALRQRIASADASILRCKSVVAALHESGFWSAREEFNLRNLIDQRNSVATLLSALLWGISARDAGEPLLKLAA
jgi:hypothetical protein